jgi:hypothetical protein
VHNVPRSQPEVSELEQASFEPVDIRDIPDDQLDDLFGGIAVSPNTKVE